MNFGLIETLTLMERTVILSFISLVLAACSSQPPDKLQTSQLATDSSSSALPPDSLTTSNISPYDTILTDRLMDFAKFADSSGFTCDTNRVKKTYPSLSTSKPINVDGFFFYDTPLNKTMLDNYLSTSLNDTSLNKRFRINFSTFAKAQSIISYFFTRKTPDKAVKEKWFTDGIVEEWKFPDSTSASAASADLESKTEFIYFNVGAFICYKDNYMYVFTSRASAFMYAIKPLYKRFAKDNSMNERNSAKWY